MEATDGYLGTDKTGGYLYNESIEQNANSYVFHGLVLCNSGGLILGATWI